MKEVIKKVYFLFILVVSMDASIYYDTNIMMIARVVIASILINLFKIKLDKKLFNALGIWLCFVLLCFIFTLNFQPTALLRYWMLFLEAFVLIRMFKQKFFSVFIDYMLVLATISLIFWVASLISLSTVFNILKPFDISGGFRKEAGDYVHTFFITVVNQSSSWVQGLPRNRGFTWEPGPFSILLNFAIFFNITYYKKKIISKSSLIFIITLITTFSTTGLLTFAFWIFYKLFIKTKNPQYVILIIILLIGFNYAFNKYDFLGKKVSVYTEKDIYVKYKHGRYAVSGSRLVGLPIIVQDLLNNPILGKGLVRTGNYEHYGEMESSFLNAIFTITSSMGLFGLFWFIIFTVKSSILISELLYIKEKYVLLLIILSSSFGFNLHIWSIIFCIITYSYFFDTRIIKMGI